MLVPRNAPIVDKVALRSIHIAVNAFIRKFNLPKGDRDDLIQDVALHLIQKVESFDPTVGSHAQSHHQHNHRSVSSGYQMA